jgi:WD40 repeat protein
MTLLDILLRKENAPHPNSAPISTNQSTPLFALSVKENATLVGTFAKQSNDNYIELVETGQKYPHRLPPSRVAWNPAQGDSGIFASTSSSLRIWKAGDDKPVQKLYSNTKSGIPSPMTSLSWNAFNASRVVTSSIDTTLSVWDIESGKLYTQLIAHDKAVLDVACGGNQHQFASVSEDGSLRLFDARDLDHSTIMYEDSVPLLRLAWQDSGRASNLLATVALDSSDVMIFDVRKPGFLVSVLRPGPACPNALSWSGPLVAGMSDGSISVCRELAPSMNSNVIAKLKPDSVLPPPSGYNGGGVTNVAMNGNHVTCIFGSCVHTTNLVN